MAKMFNPPHPASILREDVLPALGLTVTEAARQLGVSRVALSRVLNERAGISVDLARRIEAWLGPENGGSAETWLRMQIDYDLWQSNKSRPLQKIKRAVLDAAYDRYAKFGLPASGMLAVYLGVVSRQCPIWWK